MQRYANGCSQAKFDFADVTFKTPLIRAECCQILPELAFLGGYAFRPKTRNVTRHCEHAAEESCLARNAGCIPGKLSSCPVSVTCRWSKAIVDKIPENATASWQFCCDCASWNMTGGRQSTSINTGFCWQGLVSSWCKDGCHGSTARGMEYHPLSSPGIQTDISRPCPSSLHNLPRWNWEVCHGRETLTMSTFVMQCCFFSYKLMAHVHIQYTYLARKGCLLGPSMFPINIRWNQGLR